MGRDGTTAWPRGPYSASPGVDPCDAPPPCVSPSCSSSPRQTPLRPSRPRSRSPAGHRGPNCSAAPAATTTSTKAGQASPTCCERRSTSSIATLRPQSKRRISQPIRPTTDLIGGSVQEAVLERHQRRGRDPPGEGPRPPGHTVVTILAVPTPDWL